MFRTVVLTGSILSAIVHAKLYANTSTANHTCVLQTPIRSCSPASLNLGDLDTCCQETYGGLLLATQFWDTYTGYESQGQLLPEKQWTVHGLWPDLCNGSYTQYCDLNRQYDPNPSPAEINGQTVPKYQGPGIDTFVRSAQKLDLLAWMNKYWVSQGQPNSDFWAHEFSKHATCYSTFDTPCYGEHHEEHADVIDFFETVARFHKRLSTYSWLEDAGIVPSNKTSYTLSDITNALEKVTGAKPYIGCSGPRNNETSGGNQNDHGFTVLSEVWYFYNVAGRPQDGHTYAVDSSTDSTCSSASGAIKYYERTPSSEQKARM
ncbi:hypothetical protein CBS14141_002391 [Malassezia furfur]|nr:hypothetical protein CBS14141_002391 [Malassezia furfur]